MEWVAKLNFQKTIMLLLQAQVTMTCLIFCFVFKEAAATYGMVHSEKDILSVILPNSFSPVYLHVFMYVRLYGP